MTFEISLVLAILVVALTLFMTEKLSADLVAMLVLLTLALTGLVSTDELFDGFANPAVITVAAIFIVSEAFYQTGIADLLGAKILKLAGNSELLLISLMMITTGLLSAVMNNVGATAVLLPVAIGISRQTKISVSKFLMPISFASLMGGNITLIGTPPNILAADILRQYTGQTFSFFDFTPMGVLILLCGVVYMVLIGRHLLPNHPEVDLAENFPARAYLSEIQVLPGSPLVNKTLIESRLGEAYDINIVGIVRNGETRFAPRRNDLLEAEDILLVQGSLDKIIRVRQEQGLRIELDEPHLADVDLKSGRVTLAEVVLDVSSGLAGQSLKEIHFREKYRLTVLALWRRNQYVEGSIADVPLRPGDVLLVQGQPAFISLLRSSEDFLVLEPTPLEIRRTEKALLALLTFAGMLTLATLEWLPIAVAAVMAAVLLVLLGVLSLEEAYRAVDWRSIFLIGGMVPLGAAMESTNAARFLADSVVHYLSDLGPLTILLGIYVLAMLMTQSLSNAAAIVLIGPIAINIAQNLGADPRAFLMASVIAISNDYLTPIGHQANILVFGPGGYKFTDYTKVGLGLSLMLLLLVALALPIFWPLFPDG
jgi:di/tricarboxylate transporter